MDHMCRPNLGARVQRGSRWSPRGTKVLSEVAHWTTIRCQVACQIVRAPRPPPLFYALFLFTRTHFKVSRLQTRRGGGGGREGEQGDAASAVASSVKTHPPFSSRLSSAGPGDSHRRSNSGSSYKDMF